MNIVYLEHTITVFIHKYPVELYTPSLFGEGGLGGGGRGGGGADGGMYPI